MISVIVPIYNAQKYLDECIKSICRQTETELEIILVDDGSTDKSLEICESYAQKDARIIVMKKENGGVSSSRNSGISRAKGEWITFVDADDYLDNNVLKQAIDLAEKNKDKLIIWDATEVCGKQLQTCPPIHMKDIVYEEALSAIIADYHDKFYLGKYIRAAWGKLFRTEIIKNNKLFFNEQLYIGEDAIYLGRYLKYAKGICVVDSAGYYYRQISTSAVRKYKGDLLEQSRIQVGEFREMYPDKVESKMLQTAMCVLQWEIFHTLLSNGDGGFKKGFLSKEKRYRDAAQWYKVMKTDTYQYKESIRWARKLVQLQIKIGMKVPFKLQCMMVRVYDKMVNRKSMGNVEKDDCVLKEMIPSV